MPKIDFFTTIQNNITVYGLKEYLSLKQGLTTNITKARTKVNWSLLVEYLENNNGCKHEIEIHKMVSVIDYDVIENNKVVESEMINFDNDTFDFELFSNIDKTRDEIKIKNVIIDFRRRVVTIE